MTWRPPKKPRLPTAPGPLPTRPADAKRSTTQRGKSNGTRSTGTRRAAVRQKIQDVPTWATALASVVSVGVAVGVGLFATRKQWLPQAEEWGDQLQERFGKGHDDDEDNFFVEEDGDDWEAAPTATATFPATNTGATAAGAV